MADDASLRFKLLLVLAILVLVGAAIVLLLRADAVDIARVGVLTGPFFRRTRR